MDNAVFIGLMGALVGGAISGIGSYYGGIRGARQNSDLVNSHEEKLARQRLGKLLDFTCYNMRKVSQHQGRWLLSGIDTVVYDNNWPQYIGTINNLTDGDRDNIITWLTGIQKLSYRVQRGEQVFSNDVPPEHLDQDNQALITNIANELLTK